LTNVILLTVDSLRADCLEPGLMPNLVQFARQAVVFTRAYAQGPYTNMSMPSLFTGRYPSRLEPLEMHGLHGVKVGDAPTLATALAAAGYYTLGFHSNPFLSRVFGFDRGFQVFYDDLFLDGRGLPPRAKLLLNRIRRLSRSTPYLPAAALNRKLLQGLGQAREPFFLWAHFMDPHGPYAGNGWSLLGKLRAERLWRKATRRAGEITPAEREELWKGYRVRVQYLDEQLGALLAELAQRPWWGRTLLVLTADHGDEFGEHGGYTHGHKLYDELIHVPLLLGAPGAAPRTVEDVVELVGVVPTVLDFAGVRAAGSLDGESLRPAFEHRAAGRSDSLSEADLMPHYLGCLRERDWKFICEERTGREELYDLRADPGERVNVAAAHTDKAAELRRRWYERRQGSVAAGRAGKLSPEEEELVEARLRDLGYL